MFKKKEKTEKAPKNKKVRTMKVGTHKKSVLLLWAVLLASTSFGVYKNFTAIDTHTVHEKEIIQLRLNDTNGIENFVKNFAKAYYSWDTSKEAIEARTTEISKYLTKELQDLNADTIRTDIPTSVTVTNVLVWNVEQSGMNDFTVAYEVDQQVKEGEQTQAVTENYTVTVHVDKDGAMVITQNPTLAPAVQKSKYEPKVQEADVSVSSDTVKDATAFLETFFKLYPTATERKQMGTAKWIYCPICKNKTRTKIRTDTKLINFPLYCPKCKQENLINASKLKITVIKEPDT